MKQVDVTIMGQSYRLGCPDGAEASLQLAVAEVDREMCAIRDGGRVKARERIAVLAALNLAYALAGRPLPSANGTAVDLDALVARLDRALADAPDATAGTPASDGQA